MSKTAVIGWMATNAGLFSVVGALIIFFSWAVTNTLAQRYTRLKQSVETAEGTFRLYTTLHELRNQQNSLVMEILQIKEEVSRNRQSAQRSNTERHDVLNEYNRTWLSAHQIKELMDFTAQTSDFSNAVGTNTQTTHDIERIRGDVWELYSAVLQRERLAEAQRREEQPDLRTLRTAVDEYVRYVRRDAVPRVGSLYEAIVNASNKRREEGRAQLERARKNANRATRIALVLYVIGSIFALGGQYLDEAWS